MTVCSQNVNILLITTGFMIVSVLTLGCDDSMIVDAFREVLSMLDEVCTVIVGDLVSFLLFLKDNYRFRSAT